MLEGKIHSGEKLARFSSLQTLFVLNEKRQAKVAVECCHLAEDGSMLW